MKDELVSAETAILADKASFNEDCKFHYRTIAKELETSTFPTNNSDWERVMCKETTDPLVTAPTQSLLQRWLREVHKVEVESTKFTLSGFYKYKVGIRYSADHFQTYEEALESGLRVALRDLPNI